MFDLKHYTFEIFCISDANKMDIGVGRDMFLANVRAGEHLYIGEKTVPDYQKLKREYDNTDTNSIVKNIQNYTRFIKANYKELAQLFVKKDEEGFKKICGAPQTFISDEE